MTLTQCITAIAFAIPGPDLHRVIRTITAGCIRLRHTTGSLLAAGVHPKVIQSIMRHSDINLTMSRYTHILRGQESEAVAKLPDLELPSGERGNTAKGATDGGA